MNKFSINDKVVVSGKVGIGIVEQIKETKMTFKDNRESSTYEYYIQVGESWNKQWYSESHLDHYLMDEASVNKVLINVNLLYNLEFAKQLKYETDKIESNEAKKK